MENLKRIVKLLHKHNIKTLIFYDGVKDMFYIDLQTEAKSHLYLYENGELHGRYNFQKTIDFDESNELILRQLCLEFVNCLCGRDYYNSSWANLCRTSDVKIKQY